MILASENREERFDVGKEMPETRTNFSSLFLMPKIWHDELNRLVPDYGMVRAKVREVLEENFIVEPPIPSREIAGSYGFNVLFAEFSNDDKDVSGFYDLELGEIFVNSKDSPRRQSFTIAHELGHALLHGKLFKTHPEQYQVLLRSPIGAQKNPLEQEANSFAANLLVPKHLLERYQRVANANELARLFNVSDEVIRYRIAYESKYAS